MLALFHETRDVFPYKDVEKVRAACHICRGAVAHATTASTAYATARSLEPSHATILLADQPWLPPCGAGSICQRHHLPGRQGHSERTGGR